MKKLLAALVVVVFSLTAVVPAVAAERESGKKMDKKKDTRKKDKKKDEGKKGGQTAPKPGWDIRDQKKS